MSDQNLRIAEQNLLCSDKFTEHTYFSYYFQLCFSESPLVKIKKAYSDICIIIILAIMKIFSTFWEKLIFRGESQGFPLLNETLY